LPLPPLPQVTLWNTGEDAFNHAVYGDWITIERVIKDKGGAIYKTYSCTGKKVRVWTCVRTRALPRTRRPARCAPRCGRRAQWWPCVCARQVADGYKKVQALLDHLNVDAANPLAVLAQVRGRGCAARKLALPTWL
jgi:hypothetical protein